MRFIVTESASNNQAGLQSALRKAGHYCDRILNSAVGSQDFSSYDAVIFGHLLTSVANIESVMADKPVVLYMVGNTSTTQQASHWTNLDLTGETDVQSAQNQFRVVASGNEVFTVDYADTLYDIDTGGGGKWAAWVASGEDYIGTKICEATETGDTQPQTILIEAGTEKLNAAGPTAHRIVLCGHQYAFNTTSPSAESWGLHLRMILWAAGVLEEHEVDIVGSSAANHDFDDETLATEPSTGITKISGPGSGVVVEKKWLYGSYRAGVAGNLHVVHKNDAATGLWIYEIDDVDYTVDADVYSRYSTHHEGSFSRIRLYAKGALLYAEFSQQQTDTTKGRVEVYRSGDVQIGSTTLTATGVLKVSQGYVWSRFKVTDEGATTRLQVKMWTGSMGDEPGSWLFDETDATHHTSAGRVRFAFNSASTGIQTNIDVVLPVPAQLGDRPTQPNLITPYEGFVAADDLFISYDAATDPLGGTVWYHARYKKVADSAWTDIFTDRLGTDSYVHDVSGDDDGDYDFELWATTIDFESLHFPIEFTIHNGRPTPPVITAPYEGQQWEQTTNTVEWEASVDPDEDALTYDAQYRAVGAGSWTPLFTGESGLSYAWNQTALAVDDYELEVWSNDGDGDSLHDHVFFSIFIADEPGTPRVRIIEVGSDYVIAELDAYTHPTPRSWQATKWELIPWGGSWANPVESVTVTDAAGQFTYRFEGLPRGFKGIIRASFQDDANTWGDPSAGALFVLPTIETDWSRRWERNASWVTSGLGVKGSRGLWGAGYNAQPLSAIVDPGSDLLGSFYLVGYTMAGGCYCGWTGRDTELRRLGIGVFVGNSETGGEYGVFFGMEFGVATPSIAGAHTVQPFLHSAFQGCSTHSTKSLYGTPFEGYSQAIEGVTPLFGQPVGPWVTPFSHWPIYKHELWVQRYLQSETTRVRGRLNYVGISTGAFPEIYRKAAVGEQWDIDYTMPCLTSCGQPGFYQGQWAHAWATAFGEYSGLSYTALRDLEQGYVENIDPLTPYEEPSPGVCVPVTEDVLAAPVFFPAPPNGNVEEGWMQPSDLIRSRSDAEQRIALREKPVERIKFTTTLPTSREVSQLKALVWEEQPSRWGVAMWMDAATLDVTLASGSGSIPAASVDTVGRRFEECNHVALWNDQFTWDFLPATLEADGSINLTGTTSREYAANATHVLPCRIGRMMPTAEFARPSPEIGDWEVTFILEAVDDG